MTKLVKMGGFPIKQYIRFRMNPLAWLTEINRKGDIVLINPKSSKPSYVVYEPETIKEILTSKDVFFEKGNSSRVFSKILGRGLLTSEGEQHKRQRKLIQPAFHKKSIYTYVNKVSLYTEDMVSSWEDGEIRLVSQDMMNLTLRCIVKTMFGQDILEQSTSITNAVNSIIEKAAQSLFLPFSLLDSIPTIKNRNYKHSIKTLNNLVEQLILDFESKQSEEHHLLQILLQTKDEDGKSLSRQEVRDQVVTFVIAGHETTANVLSWIWFLLSQHSEIEMKFHQEIDTILAGKVPGYDDIPKLQYTHQIFQEALRLYPAAWIILRETIKEVEIRGYLFPKGSSFLISPYAVHRNPQYFTNPETFDPDRFSKNRMASISKYAYFPFGAGSRGCIGSQFAMTETLLIMAIIGQKYKLKLAQSIEKIAPEPLLSLRIKGGIHMKLEQRF